MKNILSVRFLIAVFALSVLGITGGAHTAEAATGDITGVRISQSPYKDSWVAEVDIEGLTAGGTFNMGLGTANNPETAKIVFTVTSPAFDSEGNATTVTRTIYGTRFLRQAYPNNALADTVTTGNTLTVKVMLSDYIYNADTNITANIDAGFYTKNTSNAAASGIAVVNTSTLDYPKVIGRWVWPGFERVTDDFLVEATAFQKYAKDGKPLAAMKFTATDQHGNSTSQVATTMTKSTRGTDANTVLVYAATIPVASLTQGDKIEVNFQAYPWVGVASSTLNTAITADGFAQPNERLGPLTNVLDKTGAYGKAFVLIDPLGKLGTSTGAVVYSSQAAAEAAGTATAFTTIRNAWTALRAYNNSHYGRNNAGGGTILLNKGTYNFASGTLPASTTMDTWLTIKPASTVSKSDAVLNGAANPNMNFNGMLKLDGISLVSTTTVLRDITGSMGVWLNNSYVNATGTAASQPFIGNKVFYATQNKIEALAGAGFWGTYSTSKGPAALVRGNDSSKIIYTNQYATVGNKNIITGPAKAGFIELGNTSNNQPSNNSIYAFNSAYNINTVAIYAMGKNMQNIAVVQNVLESQSAVSPLMQIAADGSEGTLNNVIVWNNSAAGQRNSFAFNEYSTTSAPRYNWSIRNNIFQLSGSKTDTFAKDPNAARIANWSAVNMVGSSNNVTQTNNTFVFEFLGLSSMFGIGNSTSTPLWVRDGSRGGTDAGNGDYQLVSNTLAVDLATSTDASSQTLPYDFNGNAVYGSMDAGAYEYIPTLSMGSDLLTASSSIRLYGDEKYRYKKSTTATSTIALSIEIPGSDTHNWLDVSVSTWLNSGTRNKVWTEATKNKTTLYTLHVVGDLLPSTPYRVTANGAPITGCVGGVCMANEYGQLSFTYSGAYTLPVTFDVIETTLPDSVVVTSTSTGE